MAGILVLLKLRTELGQKPINGMSVFENIIRWSSSYFPFFVTDIANHDLNFSFVKKKKYVYINVTHFNTRKSATCMGYDNIWSTYKQSKTMRHATTRRDAG